MQKSRIQSRRSHSRHSGVAIFYVIVAMIAMLGFVSFAVDLGRVQLAKTELRRATDAAARAGADSLPNGSTAAVNAAIALAAANKVDGAALVLQTSDVTVGMWMYGVFTAGGQSPNAVQVTARRNPIPLLFAQLLGMKSCNVTAVSVARYTPSQGGFGIVGIDSLSMKGTPETDSYDSSKGSYGASNIGNYGNVASNGDIDLQGNPTVNGWAYYGSSGSINGVAHADGSQNLVKSLSYQSVSTPSSYDNSSIASSGYLDKQNPPNFTMHSNNSSVTLAPGTYYFNNFTATGGTINVTGPVTIYVAGSVSLTGNVDDGELPSNLTVNVLPSSPSVNFGGNSSLYAQVYAPDTAVTGGGTGDFYGSVIGQTLSLGGTGAIHYDSSLGKAASPYIQLVK
jgi:Flp pilus assembly protein TadG